MKEEFQSICFSSRLVWFGIVSSRVRTCIGRTEFIGQASRLQASAVSSERSVARLDWVGMGSFDMETGEGGGRIARAACSLTAFRF